MSLSDRQIRFVNGNQPVLLRYSQEDIKAFIKADWDLIVDCIEGKISLGILIEKRNKLVGEKLT